MKGNWKKLNLGELGFLKSSGVDKLFRDGEKVSKLVNYMDVYKHSIIDNNFELSKTTVNSQQIVSFDLREGDVLFTPSSETPDDIGHSSVIVEDLINTVYSYHLIRLRDTSNLLDTAFKAYVFKENSVLKQFSQKAAGSTRYTLTKGSFEKTIISFPKDKIYQQKIAKILNTIDAVIEKTEQAIAKYQAIKKGMMHDLFTRGIDLKTGKLRPSYEDAPELYKDSELGMIPKDWNVEPLSKLGVIKSGIDYKSNPKGNKFPIYGTGGIMGWTSLYLNSGPAVLTGRKGTINNPLFVEGKFWNVDTIFCVNSINPKETDIKWLFYQFRNTDLTKLNEATGVPSVNSSALYKLLFKTPLFKEQEEIQFRITKIDTLIEKEKENLKKHQKIKKGLMQDLLTGKVEVTV